MLTKEEIYAANTIIKEFNMNPRGINSDLSERVPHLRKMAKYLEEEGLINYIQGAHPGIISLTPKGEQLQKSDKGYDDYLEEKNRKVERDEQHKDLQIEKLQIELKTLKDMQDEQRKFWQSGIERDNRQRWQFWLTWFLAGAAFIMSIINFVKSIILP